MFTTDSDRHLFQVEKFPLLSFQMLSSIGRWKVTFILGQSCQPNRHPNFAPLRQEIEKRNIDWSSFWPVLGTSSEVDALGTSIVRYLWRKKVSYFVFWTEQRGHQLNEFLRLVHHHQCSKLIIGLETSWSIHSRRGNYIQRFFLLGFSIFFVTFTFALRCPFFGFMS